MVEFTPPSGTPVTINPASFDAALTLKHAIEREMAIHMPKGLIAAVLFIDCSPEVNAALWPCLARCLYGNQKIVKETFDKPETRGDYYPIARKCIEVNLLPLGESLHSLLSEYGLLKSKAATNENQKSESTTSAAL